MTKYRCRQCKTEIRQEGRMEGPLCCGEKMQELKIQRPRPCCSDK